MRRRFHHHSPAPAATTTPTAAGHTVGPDASSGTAAGAEAGAVDGAAVLEAPVPGTTNSNDHDPLMTWPSAEVTR